MTLFDPGKTEYAKAVAERYGFVLSDTEPLSPVWLTLRPAGLTLTDGKMDLCADFSDMTRRLRREALASEMLVRALKGRAGDVSTVIDATAGLGEDSLLLAAAGLDVTLFEYDPVIAALLADALARGSRGGLAPIVSRMHLRHEDSTAAMPAMHADAVYLDPMFPERKKSGLVKKKFQLLHYLEAPCPDEEALMRSAMAAHPKKIVVKRPLHAPVLAGVRPSYSLEGSSIRYDVLSGPF